MKLLIVGHRGVGKSQCLLRLKKYFPEFEDKIFVDLDQTIEKKINESIVSFFQKNGESEFRKIESKVLCETLSLFESDDDKAIVVLGAGCRIDHDASWRVLWLQRSVSLADAVFLDRPDVAASIQEYRGKYAMRESYYQERSHYHWLMKEQRGGDNLAEKTFFRRLMNLEDVGKRPYYLEPFKNGDSRGEGQDNLQPILTLELSHFFSFANQENSKELVHRGQSFSEKGIQEKDFSFEFSNINERFFDKNFLYPGVFLEWRDDVFSEDQLKNISGSLGSRSLLSFRSRTRVESSKKLIPQFLQWDWPLEMGPCHWGTPSIFSLHTRESTLNKTFQKISKYHQGQLKLAIPIESFKELQEGLLWQEEEPQRRSFLPCSNDGRWQWFRQRMLQKQPLNYFKTSVSRHLDQPSYQQVMESQVSNRFAGVLGCPVVHSLSPWIHKSLFEKMDSDFYSISLGEHEFIEAMEVLVSMGLIAAAVTSPLKKVAGSWLGHDNPDFINTLFFDSKSVQWQGANTDVMALGQLCEPYQKKSVALWGGGGTSTSLATHFPHRVEYSARSGKPREGFTELESPEVVICSIGRERYDKTKKSPPLHWKPKVVFDLNYAQNSPGRIWAKQWKSQYIDGLEMFLSQAQFQQKIWRDYVC